MEKDVLCKMKSACSSRGAALLELPFTAVFIHDSPLHLSSEIEHKIR